MRTFIFNKNSEATFTQDEITTDVIFNDGDSLIGELESENGDILSIRKDDKLYEINVADIVVNESGANILSYEVTYDMKAYQPKDTSIAKKNKAFKVIVSGKTLEEARKSFGDKHKLNPFYFQFQVMDSVNESSEGEWVLWAEYEKGKKLVKKFASAKTAQKAQKSSGMLDTEEDDVLSIGTMSLFDWDKNEAKYAINESKKAFNEFHSFKEMNDTGQSSDYYLVDIKKNKIVAGLAEYNVPKWVYDKVDTGKFLLVHFMAMKKPSPYLKNKPLNYEVASSWINEGIDNELDDISVLDFINEAKSIGTKAAPKFIKLMTKVQNTMSENGFVGLAKTQYPDDVIGTSRSMFGHVYLNLLNVILSDINFAELKAELVGFGKGIITELPNDNLKKFVTSIDDDSYDYVDKISAMIKWDANALVDMWNESMKILAKGFDKSMMIEFNSLND